MTGYKGSVLDGMDIPHVAFCCIERCNPQPTTMADGVVNFFVRRSGIGTPVLGAKIVVLLTKTKSK
jgi:hypothetical protein